MSTQFPIDLGSKGPGPYRLLRAGKASLVDKFKWSTENVQAAQQERLAFILRLVRGSAFGQAHQLSSVRTFTDLRGAVPIRNYAGLADWIARIEAGEPNVLSSERVNMLLETSGTSGRPKLIPSTASWERSVAEAQSLWVLSMLQDHPAVSSGKALTIVSPPRHAQTVGGIPIGSNTGRMHAAQPWWVKRRYAVPDEVFAIEDQELKWYVLLRFAMQEVITSITTANPSTLLLLCRRMLEWRLPLSRDLEQGSLRHGPACKLGRLERFWFERRLRKTPPPADFRPASVWPLQVVNCWKGGASGFFVSRLPEALGGNVPIREVGITASEGYFALPLGDSWPGGVLWSMGHVMEFVDEAGQERWAWELEEGERVRLVITTESGLIRYDLADTLEVVGSVNQAPVMRFVGKTGRWLNATGEKVTEDQVAEAVRVAGDVMGSRPVGFTCRVEWGEVPRFELALEGVSPGLLAAWGNAFDFALQRQNVEYSSKRESARLGPPLARLLVSGTYARWRSSRVGEGAPDGQVKDPVIAIDETEWNRVLAASC